MHLSVPDGSNANEKQTMSTIKKKLGLSKLDDTQITLLSHCAGFALFFQLAVKSLIRTQISFTMIHFCCCIQSAEFRVRRFGLVSLAKYLLPATLNSTLKVVKLDNAG
jgi:hypothetical protein